LKTLLLNGIPLVAIAMCIPVVAARWPLRETTSVAPANKNDNYDDDTDALRNDPTATLMEVLRPKPGQHPLLPLVRWAESRIGELRAVEDYEGIFTKQEQVDGLLRPKETILLRVRHRPFSVYMRYLEPLGKKEREVLYVAGENRGRLKTHGATHSILGNLSLSPASPLAMRGNRHPITDIGLLNLTERMVELGNAELSRPNCTVNLSKARFAERPCVCIEVAHPRPEPHQLYQRAVIYIDGESNLPVRYEAYAWISDTEGSVEPFEEYTYRDLHFNRGFRDIDFSAANPDYAF
jgi:hypothetical protein